MDIDIYIKWISFTRTADWKECVYYDDYDNNWNDDNDNDSFGKKKLTINGSDDG